MNRRDYPHDREQLRMELIHLLIESDPRADELVARDPALLDEGGRRGEPALHCLVVEDHGVAVRRAIQLGASPDSRDADGQTPLGAACMCGRLGCARILLDAGVSPDSRGFNDDFVLHIAASHQHPDLVMLLLERGARADYLMECGGTIFRSLADWEPKTRAMIVEALAARGVTREGLFAKFEFRDCYDSMEHFYRW